MTVIAYRDGVLASDSRETWSKTFIGNDKSKKLFRLPDGSYLALAGNSANGFVMLEAFKRMLKAKAPTKKDLPNGPFKGVEAILVDANGKVFVYAGGWGGMEQYFSEGYAAIGSGYVEAMTAMDLGADAVGAVKAAIKRNTYCGGRVQKMGVK